MPFQGTLRLAAAPAIKALCIFVIATGRIGGMALLDFARARSNALDGELTRLAADFSQSMGSAAR